MEALKEFVDRNPDVRTKVITVAAVFLVFSFVVTRALLSSLALTILYTILYTLILWVVRGKRLMNGVRDGNEDQMLEDDFEEDDVIPWPSKADEFDESISHNDLTHRKPVSVFFQSQKENSEVVFESNVKQAKHPEQYVYQSSPKDILGSGNKRNIDTPRPFLPVPNRQSAYENMYGSKVGTPRPSFEMYQKPYIPGKMKKPQVDQDKDFASPNTANLLGVNRWGLSRQPLHQTDLNTPPTGGSQHYWERGKTKQLMFFPPKVGLTSRPSSRMSAVNVSSAGPQTSSPFHDSSQIGLWDTMSLSAIAGSPAHFISPITSPTTDGDKINSPSEHLHVGSPYLSKGLGNIHKHHPVHTSGRPVELTRHSQPTSALSGQWQKWSKEQTAVKVGGRPKLQSPVTIKIAHPDRFQMLTSRYNRSLTGNAEETPESLKKDVILSALREKRKRGKVEQNQSLNQEGNSSSEETQTGSHLKKRRLNTGNESQELLDEPVAKSSHSGRTHGRSVKSVGGAKDKHLSRPSSANSTGGPDSLNESMKSCRRNAIESSLSSSRMWRENRLKRGLQPDEKETVPVGPPKKVSRATDVSGLVSEGKKMPERKEDSETLEKLDVSREEKIQGGERPIPSIPQRLRKRAVFTTIHRGKQTKPPSPNQVTAADLIEDRQRARERIQQMRELLRDEMAPPRETPKNADKPLLPAEKPLSLTTQSSTSSSTSVSLTSTFTVSKPSTTMSQTELDGSSKSSKGKGGLLDQLLKEDPITKKLAEDAKKKSTPAKSSLSSTPSGLGLFNTTPSTTSTLSVSVSNQSSSSSPSKPTSLLQALSSMRQTTQADQTLGSSTLSAAGGLGFKIGQSNQVTTTSSAVLPSVTTQTTSSLTKPSTSVGSLLGTFTAAPTVPAATTTKAPPTFNFGSSSLSGTSSAQTQPTASSQQQQPSFQFGSSAPSAGTQINFNAPGQKTEAAPAQSLFSFGASSTNPSLSGTQSQVSSSSQTLTSAVTSSSSMFTFGSAAVSKQSTAGSSTLTFGATNSASAQPSQNKVTFGASAPSFNFGSAKTDQTSGSTPSFTFGGGPTVPLSSQSSSAPAPAQFSFGAKSSSAAPSLFQQTPSQAGAVALTTTVTSSLFAFGGAASKPGSISSTAVSSAAALPSFSFGSQSAPSSTFTFGSQQNKPAPQSSLFASSQPSQPAGPTFGSQSATNPTPLFPSAAALTATPQQQQPQQSGFSFGSQPAQTGALFQSSTSTPSLTFGAPNQTAPSASGFQFGGSAGGAQQQSAPSFNFSATPSTPSFNFGGDSNVPQFGQGQVTPVKPAGGFSMGTTTAPRKTASARMRQRARASRR